VLSPPPPPEELQLRYGVGCPFARVEDARRERLDALEQKVKALKEDAERVKVMEQFLADKERQLKSLEEESAAASEATTTSDPPGQEPPRQVEEEEVPDWVPVQLKFFLDGYDALATNRPGVLLE
ncbi:hypothetical protein PMAYCL1PPCAC_03336, partial [Pristionchus mayeri]